MPLKAPCSSSPPWSIVSPASQHTQSLWGPHSPLLHDPPHHALKCWGKPVPLYKQTREPLPALQAPEGMTLIALFSHTHSDCSA
jgi:hypothetical protein